MRQARSLAKRALARLHLLGFVGRMLGRPDPDVLASTGQHGHALLLQLLPKLLPAGTLKGYLVEVGTTREQLEGQGSTVHLARLAARLGMEFITVDMDPANSERARYDMRGIRGASAVTSKGEDFLAAFEEPIVAAYLDAFDIQHGQHSSYRIERYRTLLDAEITNEAAAEMHRACAEALVPRMVDGGLIVIDDTTTDGASFGGKGATAVPLLLSRGFRIVASTPTAIALQRTGTGQ